MSKVACCTRFMELVSSGEGRGLSIVPKRHPSFGDSFFLQFRATAREYEEVLIETDVPVARYVEQAITFCPWCGARLGDVYSADRFDELPFVMLESEI